MSVIGQAIRQVSLAGFSQTSRREGDQSLATGLSLAWAAALPVGVLLAALASPLVALFYGQRWAASAGVLAAFDFFGALRVALDMIATYLMAAGSTRPVLYVQLLWFFGLIPAVVGRGALEGHRRRRLGARCRGRWCSSSPAYAVALRQIGVSPRSLLAALWPPGDRGDSHVVVGPHRGGGGGSARPGPPRGWCGGLRRLPGDHVPLDPPPSFPRERLHRSRGTSPARARSSSRAWT